VKPVILVSDQDAILKSRWSYEQYEVEPGIYLIQFVSQFLIRHEFIFLKIPERPPVSGEY